MNVQHSDPPRVSVIIPTYNRPDMAARSARCALAQEGVDVEVIVIDDCSPDVDEATVRAQLPEQAHLHRMRENGGVSRARNTGLEIATGEWVTFLDDDDVISTTKVASQVDACRRADKRWAISAVCVVDESLTPIRVDELPPINNAKRQLLSEYVLPAVMSNVLVSAELAHDIGPLDARFFHNADWDYCTRLALRGDPVAVHSPDVGYVLHSRNVSGIPTGKYEDMELFESKFATERAAAGAPSSIPHSLRWIGMTSGRFGQRDAARKAYLEAYRQTRHRGDLLRFAAVNLPRYARLMDARQRAAGVDADRADLQWLSRIGATEVHS